MSAPPQAVEAYLRAATWPLPRAVRGEARAELLAHLWQLRLDAEVRGLNAQDAWQEALTHAGPAWRVAFGLARVHSLRALRCGLLVGAALGSAAYAVQRPGGPPLSVPAAAQAQP